MTDLKISDLNALNEEDNYKLLAKHMPKGLMWTNCFNIETNIGKLIYALSIEYYRMSVLSEDEIKEYDIDQTERLLEKWEKSVGIPTSEVFNNDNMTIDDRRKNVKYLLCNFWGVQTAQDFERVAGFYGYTVSVEAYAERVRFPVKFPIPFVTEKTMLYTILVTMYDQPQWFFPIEFPYILNVGYEGFLKVLFELLAPANCQLKFVNSY